MGRGQRERVLEETTRLGWGHLWDELETQDHENSQESESKLSEDS